MIITPQNIAQLRTDSGLNLSQFAQFFAVTPPSVLAWETGKNTPSPMIQVSMARLRERIDEMRRAGKASDEVKGKLLALLLAGGLIAIMFWLFSQKNE